MRRDVLTRLSHLAPGIVFYLLTPLAFEGYPGLVSIAVAAVALYAIVIVVLVIDSLLSAGMDVYETFDIADQIPIKGFVQVAKLVLYEAFDRNLIGDIERRVEVWRGGA